MSIKTKEEYSPVLQTRWSYTSSDSDTPQLKTGIIGPCFVVNFLQKSEEEKVKYAAMAHIDSKTDLSSIKQIFDLFKEKLVNPADVKVLIIGGWDTPELKKRARHLISYITDAGYVHISNLLFSKRNMITDLIMGTLKTPPTTTSAPSKLAPYYHIGFLIDSRNTKSYIVKNIDPEIDRLEKEREIKDEEAGTTLDIVYLSPM